MMKLLPTTKQDHPRLSASADKDSLMGLGGKLEGTDWKKSTHLCNSDSVGSHGDEPEGEETK